MVKMISLKILLTTTTHISPIIVYVTHTASLSQWLLAVHFTLCLLTHINMVSIKLHTLEIFRV
jgi:hypothetical protein